jgi:hypothetical protein
MMPASDKESCQNLEDAMYIDIIWKTALPALIGLFAVAAVVMNSNAVRNGARGTAVGLANCNVHDPFSPCFADNFGDPARDLFVEYF